MLNIFFIGLLTSALGTFLGNLALLSLIGKRAEAIEKERVRQLQYAQEKIAKAIREKQERMKEYVKMES